MLVAILCALACSILWGISYTALQPVSAKLQPETINIVYGTALIISNLALMIARNTFSDFYLLKDSTLALYLSGYVVFSVVALFVFLIGYKLIGNVYAGAFVAISSTYPIVVFVLTYIFFNQRDFKLYMVIPGFIGTCVGIILLSLAK
jgi:drug/metabolite transporter (DMT)-like permease